MNMLFEIFTDKNNPAQMWSAHTIKHLSSVKVDAVMICLITDWINTLIEICIDKKKKKPCTTFSKLYHQAFELVMFIL